MTSSSEAPPRSKTNSPTSNPSSPSIDPENPFIAFRRFADSQVSSLLQSVIGLPSLFSQPEAKDRWSSVDDLAAKRGEATVRVRPDLIDMLERDIQESLKEMPSMSKRREEEMQKWGAVFDAAKLDWPIEKPQRKPNIVPTGQEKLGWDGKMRTWSQTSMWDGTSKDREESFIVSTSEGNVNLKRVVDHRDEGQGFWLEKDDPRLKSSTAAGRDPFVEPDQAIAWLLSDDYSPLYLDRSMPYKLDQTFYQTDADDSYFRRDYRPGDLYPRFASESIVRHDPRVAEKVDWRAAFHDLLEIHHKGTLTQSSPCTKTLCSSTLMAPAFWISYLVDRGSLGSKWSKLSHSCLDIPPYLFRYGKSPEAWAVSSFLDQHFVRDCNGRYLVPQFGRYERKHDSLPMIAVSPEVSNSQKSSNDQPKYEQLGFWGTSGPKSNHQYSLEVCEQSAMLEEALDDDWLSFRPAFTKAAISIIRNPNTEQATLRAIDRVLRMIENPELADEVEEILTKAFEGTDLTSPFMLKGWVGEIDKAFRNDHLDKWKTAKEAVDSAHHDVYGISFDDTKDAKSSSSWNTLSDSNSSSFSSSSSYSSSYDSSSTGSPNSIISTLTNVESRTLPDGRVETKRVLKKRFADGREESSESTETCSGLENHRPAAASGPRTKAAEVLGELEPSVALAQDRRKRGGWFWRS